MICVKIFRVVTLANRYKGNKGNRCQTETVTCGVSRARIGSIVTADFDGCCQAEGS